MEGGTYSGRHVLGRWQVGEWRGWAGRHAAGLGLRLAAGAGTARHTTGWEEDGERRWGHMGLRGSVLLGESRWHAMGQGT